MRTAENRTVIGADGHPVLMPNVLDRLGQARRMFLDLARAWAIDLAASTHVGDSPKDRAAAQAAGIGQFVWANEFFSW